ncbi:MULTISPECIES: LysR family transcriptional regulator [Acidiphilium]|uniref:HTH-type transcriptional regulator CbbR n=1 Tax=Acidiphilium rubrum TaxID=526 RepID=A0A8G2CL93_ACIRU|nr:MULTISPECIES: LysR family transcriptional regulator [Acidiphilium]MBW4034047.1 LysR family transcriptional regulator [Pseudomonadota bacterium]SIQ95943.1 transcriptional regulator, LysR family [Acidiphilium rubrum]
MHITLRQLRAIAALHRHGSVTRAAGELNVSPPAVTLQVKALEDQLGIALVERSAGGMVLTQGGMVIADASTRIEAVLRESEARLAAIVGAERGEVRVGIISTAKYYAPRALAAFSRAHPGIDLRLTVGNRDEIIDGLVHHVVDLAIMGRPPTELKVIADEIGDHPHVVVAPPDHRLATARDIAPNELNNEVMLVREAGSGTRRLMEFYCEEAGITPRIGMEIGSNETIKQSVMAGLGISFISAHTIDAEVQDGRLVVLDITGLPIIRQWFAVHLTERAMMPASAALLGFLREQGGSFLPHAAIESLKRSSSLAL